VNRERLVTLYGVLVGGLSWLWLLSTPGDAGSQLPALVIFGLTAFAVDALAFRMPPADLHSLAGVVLLSAALTLGPETAAALAAVEGLLSALALFYFSRRARTVYAQIGRPLLRSGLRSSGILLGGLLAAQSGLPLIAALILSYVPTVQFGRALREWLLGGHSGLTTWWRSAWTAILAAEIAPLPLAMLGAAIAAQLGAGYLLLAGGAVIAAAAVVRSAALTLQQQRRSVDELAQLNGVSRAIIRSELDSDALCELIYRETSRVVDTSSFHLGLFDGDQYTLVVRVQDRVRQPRLTVNLAQNGGLIGWIRATGKPLLVEDFSVEMQNLPARPRYQSERPPRSGIYVPLIAGEQVIGSISVQSYRPNAFGNEELRLISLIADQAAVALDRARAFGEAKRRANQLQAIREVSEQITAILDLDRLLPSVVRLISERFGYDPVHIFTTEADGINITFRASTAVGVRLERMHRMQLSIHRGLVGDAVRRAEPVLVADVQQDPRYVEDSPETRSELAVPLRIGNTVIGVLDVQSDRIDDFDADDLFIMRTLADQIAIAIDSANTYSAQQEEAWTLNALLQIAENTGRAATLSDLAAAVVRLPPLLLGCPRSHLVIWDRDEDALVLFASDGWAAERRDALIGNRLPAALADLLPPPAEARLMVIERAAERRELWPQLIDQAGSQALVVLPIVARNALLGLLLLDYDEPTVRLTARQQSLCAGAAAQIAGALESLLLAVEAAEAARLDQELRVARDIQTALLPSKLPQIPGWQIDAAWHSARMVGGDFYDLWTLPGSDGRLGFVIADVSDKGVPAAMFMAMARSLVRAAALDGSPPATALQRANRWISRDSESGMFVTLFYGQLSPQDGHLQFSNAGHNPPLIYRAAGGTFEELRLPGMALGVLEELTLNHGTAVLEPGDLLICYTDGVTEAVDDRLRQFEVDGIKAVVQAYRHAGAGQIVQAILAAVDRHVGDQPAFDDVTLLVLRRN
jgi:serine phosphatase RsbU (regulator of sigma subunit)/putative methionine-R-sulfoxide reductase with GAF domain